MQTGQTKADIYAAAISPFTPDGRLDTPKLVSYCRHLLSDGGCDGVAPLGTTGEGNSIGFAERLRLPEAFATAGIDGEKVIFGTGASAVSDAIELTRAAVDQGFPNALVLPPFYYKEPDDEGLYSYYSTLIEGVGSDTLRLHLYHFPQMSAVPLSPGLVLRLRDAFGPIVAGLKDSSGSFAQSQAFAEATGGVAAGFSVYPSSEAFYSEGAAIGCAGVISGSTNVFGALLRRAVETGDTKSFDRVKTAREMIAKYPLIAAMKQIEAWRTGDPSWLRQAPPLLPLSDADRAALRTDLQALGLLGSDA